MAKAVRKKPQRKKPKVSDQKQAERFIETARQFGADETGKTFEDAFKKIVPPKAKNQ